MGDEFLASSTNAPAYIKTIAKGAVFIKYEATSRRQVFVFYSNSPDNLRGMIWWCDPGSKVEIKANSLPMKSISDIFIGKYTEIFQSASGVGHLGVVDNCFSLASKKVTLDLESTSKDERDLWVKCIYTILKNFGKKAKEGTEKDKNATPSKSEEKDKPKEVKLESKPTDKDSLVAAITKGSVFDRYHVDKSGKVEHTSVFVFYQPNRGSKGSLAWCPPERREAREASPDSTFSLSQIYKLAFRKGTPALANVREPDSQVLTVFYKKEPGLELNLVAPDQNQASLWATALKALLDKKASPAPAQNAETVAIAAGPHPGPSRPPVEEKKAAAAEVESKNTEKMGLALMACKRLLTKGGNFTLLENGRQSQVFMFYSDSAVDESNHDDDDDAKSKTGALYWCARNSRVEDPSRRLFMHNIMELTRGGVDDGQCFSLVHATSTSTTSLNVQTSTPQECDVWLKAIHFLLTAVANLKQGESKKAHGVSSSTRARLVKQKTMKKQAATLRRHQQSQILSQLGPEATELKRMSDNRETSAIAAAAAASEPLISEVNPTILYSLTSKIGDGVGQCESVWKARDNKSGEVVVVKVIWIEGKSGAQVLRKEVAALKALHNSNIVSYKGAYQSGNELWIVMEYLEAGSLRSFITRDDPELLPEEKTLSEEDLACVLKMCLRGLAYLHSTRCMHRDVKASNILLTAGGECKLADFGLSAEANMEMNKNSAPHWMAPEVIGGEIPVHKEAADIWSLGITAIELAEGEPPHSDIVPLRAIVKIRTSSPPTLKDQSKWSENFRLFIKAVLAHAPAERPSAEELLKHPFIAGAGDASRIQRLFAPYLERKRRAELKETSKSTAPAATEGLAVPALEVLPAQAKKPALAPTPAVVAPPRVSTYKQEQFYLKRLDPFKDVPNIANLSKEELERILEHLSSCQSLEEAQVEKVYNSSVDHLRRVFR